MANGVFIWLMRLRRLVFGIKNFSRKEVRELWQLHRSGQVQLYSFRIFQRVKKIADGEFDFVSDDAFYTVLAPALAKANERLSHELSTLNYIQFQEKILTEVMTLEHLLKGLKVQYPGSKFSKKD